MYAGRIVEERNSDDIFSTPSHPYTRGLVASLPRLGGRAAHGQSRLQEIKGVVPAIAHFPPGCRFNPRCRTLTDICRQVEPAVESLEAAASSGVIIMADALMAQLRCREVNILRIRDLAVHFRSAAACSAARAGCVRSTASTSS